MRVRQIRAPRRNMVDEHFAHPLVDRGALRNGRDLIQRQLQKPHFSLLRSNLAAGEVDLLLGRGRLAFDLPDELGVRRRSVLILIMRISDT